MIFLRLKAFINIIKVSRKIEKHISDMWQPLGMPRGMLTLARGSVFANVRMAHIDVSVDQSMGQCVNE
jgi:hypothetical protein